MLKLFDKLAVVCVALTLLAIVGPVAHVYDEFVQEYWLEKSLHHTIILTVAENDYGIRGSGSGVIVGKLPLVDAAGCSLLVITAYHNTAITKPDGEIISFELELELINGAPTEVLRESADDDLILLYVEDAQVEDCKSLTAAEISTELPPLGGSVWVTGFPGRVPHLSRGIYGGLDTLRWRPNNTPPGDKLAAYNASTGPGGSGGGIWYKGALVGIVLQRADVEKIGSMLWAATPDMIAELLADAPL